MSRDPISKPTPAPPHLHRRAQERLGAGCLTSSADGCISHLPLKPLFPVHRAFVRPLLFAVALFLCVSCDKSDDTKITVYRIPKETQRESNPQQVAMDGAAPAEVHWTAPSGWEEQPASGFRKGSFLVRGSDGKTADVSVISFPGSGRRRARECQSLARSVEAPADLG